MPVADALDARDTIMRAISGVRMAAARGREAAPELLQQLPSLDRLQKALAATETPEASTVSPVRRAILYAVVAGGFSTAVIGPRLRKVQNASAEPVGETLFNWMSAQLNQYEIKLRLLDGMDAAQAMEMCIRLVRARLREAEIASCDPENLRLQACRQVPPDDSDFVTTITTSGDFPVSLANLASVFDPRQWHLNPYATHFQHVATVTDSSGATVTYRPEAVGSTWAEPAWILETVVNPAGGVLKNTLRIQYVVTTTWVRLTYALGETLPPNTVQLERDFGYINIDPIAARPGWCRIAVEKNVRFSSAPGAPGGFVGWGNLPNAMAPDLVGKWLWDMRLMPCG